MDHKPLIALFGPTKATPALAANRLARWALMLSQYNYSIEYRKTSDHGNADALSHLPVGPDVNFDGEEGDADMDTVCTIKTVSLQLNPTDPGTLAKESTKDLSSPMLCAIREKDGHLRTYQTEVIHWRFFARCPFLSPQPMVAFYTDQEW